MSIPASAQAAPIQPPLKLPWVDKDTGLLTQTAQLFLQQIFRFLVSMNRLIPCNCTNVGNAYTLTTLASSPLVKQYNDYDIFTFAASATSTGNVTAKLVTGGDTLATIKAFKTNGAAQAAAGDVVSGSLYLAIYNDALDAAAGGFVLK